MSVKYNLSPTEKLNYVQKGNIPGGNKKIFKQVLLSFFILGFLVLLAVPYLKNYNKRKNLEAEIARIEEDVYRYERTNEELKEFLVYLESDQAVIEKARVNLGLQRNGESVVVIKRKDSINEKNGDFGGVALEDVGNFKKWVRYFFNN